MRFYTRSVSPGSTISVRLADMRVPPSGRVQGATASSGEWTGARGASPGSWGRGSRAHPHATALALRFSSAWRPAEGLPPGMPAVTRSGRAPSPGRRPPGPSSSRAEGSRQCGSESSARAPSGAWAHRQGKGPLCALGAARAGRRTPLATPGPPRTPGGGADGRARGSGRGRSGRAGRGGRRQDALTMAVLGLCEASTRLRPAGEP